MKNIQAPPRSSPRVELNERFSSLTGGSLFIFDVDDVLLSTKAKIIVRNSLTGLQKELSTTEYATFTPSDGDDIDLSQFGDSKLFLQSETIREPLDILLTLQEISNRRIDKDGSRVIMLTARNDFDDKNSVLEFFKGLNIDVDRVHFERAARVGYESTSENKKTVVRNYLKSNNFSSVTTFDDSTRNLKAINSLCCEFPDTEFYAFAVGPNGNVEEFETIAPDSFEKHWSYSAIMEILKKIRDPISRAVDSIDPQKLATEIERFVFQSEPKPKENRIPSTSMP